MKEKKSRRLQNTQYHSVSDKNTHQMARHIAQDMTQATLLITMLAIPDAGC